MGLRLLFETQRKISMRADGEQTEGFRFTSLEEPGDDLGTARLLRFGPQTIGPPPTRSEPTDVSPAHRTDEISQERAFILKVGNA